jgi:hypothetical protein
MCRTSLTQAREVPPYVRVNELRSMAVGLYGEKWDGVFFALARIEAIRASTEALLEI